MLSIKNLVVSLKNEDKKILDGLDLEIKDGEIHAIMGPNGTGKSTLSKAIMGHFLFNVLDGDIIFNDVRLNDLSVDERAKAGIFLAMQDPTVVDGVTNSEFLKNEDKKILDGLNLEIKDGEIHAIMGPNGTGKSTLSKTIMGHFLFNVLDGDIIFNDVRLNELSVDERAKAGIFLAMQDPTVVDGVTNSEFLKNAYEEQTGNHIDYFKFISEVNKSLDDLKFSRDMIHRDVNAGFSGGEKKKNEVLQIKILKPKLIILDEIDSGLDVDSLKVVCENINEYKNEFPDTSILIITHYPRILEAIKPDYVHIMKNGKIVKTGDLSLALETEQVGYNE